MTILKKFHSLLEKVNKLQSPDLHISSNSVPYVRDLEWHISPIPQEDKFSHDELVFCVKELLGDDRYAVFKKNLEFDISYTHNGVKFRINIYNDSKWVCVAIRQLSDRIPTLQEVGINENIKSILQKPKGLILVTGSTGSGKSTTLAAILEYINQNYHRHIVTIEDPIEYVIESKKSLVHQREIGKHTHSAAGAIRSVLREDPDIVMVGEMRDADTISAALTLAETGHLVFSTLHTNDAVGAIERIIDSFPEGKQHQTRVQLSMNLLAILAQMLVPKVGGWRIVAREILVNTDAVSSLILRQKPHLIYSTMEISSKEGMILMDKYLEFLYKKWLIDRRTLEAKLRDKDVFTILKPE